MYIYVVSVSDFGDDSSKSTGFVKVKEARSTKHYIKMFILNKRGSVSRPGILCYAVILYILEIQYTCCIYFIYYI